MENFKSHPESRANEALIGNTTKRAFQSMGWKTKRLGKTAYGKSGEPIPKFEKLQPVFVSRQELLDAGIDPDKSFDD